MRHESYLEVVLFFGAKKNNKETWVDPVCLDKVKVKEEDKDNDKEKVQLKGKVKVKVKK